MKTRGSRRSLAFGITSSILAMSRERPNRGHPGRPAAGLQRIRLLNAGTSRGAAGPGRWRTATAAGALRFIVRTDSSMCLVMLHHWYLKGTDWLAGMNCTDGRPGGTNYLTSWLSTA